MYNNIIGQIQIDVISILNKIVAVHNFEYGAELEIAFCNIFRKILPERYGICRGYVVTKDDVVAGDDIIIYNKSLFPELRLFENNDYISKQYIPIEAVLVYIECKNTLEIADMDSKNSIKSSLSQIRKVRNLINKREKRKWNEYDGYISEMIDTVKKDYYLPNNRNDPYTILLSRYYSIDGVIKKENSNQNEIIAAINKIESEVDFDAIDFQVINESCIITRNMINKTGQNHPNIFNIKGSTIGFYSNVKAFGILISIVLHICDFINLKPINWIDVINEEINN